MSFFAKHPQLTVIEQIQARQQQLRAWKKTSFAELFLLPFDQERVATHNCENLIGSVAVPVGVAGPLLISTPQTTQEVLIPLATTEGALVASVNRGCKAIQAAGGVRLVTEKVGMSRAPAFALPDVFQAQAFHEYLQQKTTQEELVTVAEATSQHLHAKAWQSWQRGRIVFLRGVFDTEEAMGMNMVTIAMTAVSEFLQSHYSHLQIVTISSNVCVDKKESALNRLLGRGYHVEAEVILSEEVLHQVLKTQAAQLLTTHQVKNEMGSNLAGSFSHNMQVANVVSAFFLATGQDVAHSVEASQANLFLELVDQPIGSGVRVTLSLPNLNLGSVGGGTWLPAQSQARALIQEQGPLTAQRLAEVVAGAALAAEISGLAALATKTLTQAHQRLARGKKDASR